MRDVVDSELMLVGAGIERFEVEELRVGYRVPDDFLLLAAADAPAGGAAVPEGVREARDLHHVPANDPAQAWAAGRRG